MSNSAFTPTVLTIPATGGGGTGQGELSLITNGSAVTDITGWTNVSRVTSNSPLNPLIPTAFSISNAAGAENSTSGGYASFTLPTGLQNRKLKVEFYYTTPATDVYRVSVYKGSTRVALSTDSSGATTLPANTTGKFTAYFDTDNSASWSLNVTRTNGTTGPVYITNVVVGPGIQPQGAVVGEWTIFPMVIEGITTNPTKATSPLTDLAAWRRVGSHMEIMYTYVQTSATGAAAGSGAYLFNMPTGYNIDNTKLGTPNIGGDGDAVVGEFRASDGTNRFNGRVQRRANTNKFLLVAANDTLADGFVGSTRIPLSGATATYSFMASVPIAEWAGSGTVQLAQNDVEYAYNTTAWGTSNTTAFGYGPGGASITGALSAEFAQRVRFQTPIQPGDQLILEFRNSSSDPWISQNQYVAALLDSVPLYTGIIASGSSDTHGASLVRVASSATDVDVYFGRYVNRVYNGTTMQTKAWASGPLWRVRKTSAGAAVGFGLAAQAQSGLISQEVSGTFTGTLTGVSTTVTGTCRYTVVGKMVTLFLPDMTGTSNTTVQCTITGLPAVITPQRGQWVMGTFTDNGAQGLALHEVSTAGTVKANRFTAINSITGGTTGSGTKGFATQTLTYSLD